MSKYQNRIEKLEFLLGNWNMEYNVPESELSAVDRGTGIGHFKKILNDNYITFNYSATLTQGKGRAKGIFAWDEQAQFYRYWWFEDSGNFDLATCNFINDNTLFMKWQNNRLIQTFTKAGDDKIILHMHQKSSKEQKNLVLEVILTRIH